MECSFPFRIGREMIKGDKKPSLLIITGIFPPDIGGPATYVPLIAQELLSRGYEVLVVTSSEPQHMHHPAVYPYGVLRLPRRISKAKRTLLLVRTIIKEGRRFDLLFVNGFHVEAALANIFLRKPCLMKVVGDFAWEPAYGRWTDIGFLEFQKSKQGIFLEVLKLIRNWSVKKADTVIVPSRFMQEIVAGWGVDPERSRVIYNAVSASREELTETRELRYEGEALKIISIGRLIELKNFDKAIRAISVLPNAELTIVGEGPLEGDIRGLIAELGLEGRVKLIGKVPHDRMPCLMREHDVLLLASSHEAFPHVIVEAMSEGLVVVATGVGGVLEVIRDGENGLLVEPEEESISRALRLLLEKPHLRKKLSGEAVRDARSRFGLSAMVEKTEKAIEDAMTARRNKAGPITS